MSDPKSPDWTTILEVSITDATVKAILRTYKDEPREKQLIRMVCVLTLQKQEMHELLVKKCITEPATIFLRDSVTPLKAVLKDMEIEVDAIKSDDGKRKS